jgi:predicted RNA-binding protein with PUA-like domain
MAKQYWLFKSEPDSFSIDDLKNSPHGLSTWDGVRNYQARNMLRDDIKLGDEVLFYHSSTKPPGVAGICRIVKSGYPDPTALDSGSDYFDPRATRDNPIWYAVDVTFVYKFPKLVPLTKLKETPGLEEMMVTKRGSRLSIQLVTAREWKIVLGLAGKSPNRA